MTEKMLRITEVAKVFDVTESCIRSWVLQRKIRYIKVGRSVRIPSGAVDELVEAGTVIRREEESRKSNP